MLNLNTENIAVTMDALTAKLDDLTTKQVELETAENFAYARAEAADLPEAEWAAADEAAENAHAARVRNEYHMDRVRTMLNALQTLWDAADDLEIEGLA